MGPYEKDKSRRSSSSYSIISNNNTEVFGTGGIIYGYNTFNPDLVEHMYELDSHSYSFARTRNKSANTTDRPNRISKIEEIAETPGYNEIILKNEVVGKNKYNEIKPNFIVVIDKIDEKSIKESKRLNIPIIIVKKAIKKRTITNFNMDRTENYTTRDIMEEIRKSKR